MNLVATLIRDRAKRPLIQLDSDPFNGLCLSPFDAERLANRLLALATEANLRPTDDKHYLPKKVLLGDKQ